MRKTRNIILALVTACCLTGVAHGDRPLASDRPLVRPAPAAGADRADERSLAAGASRGFMEELVPTGLALGATLLTIVLARSAVRRFGVRVAGGRRPQGVVEVLARYPVARGQQVVLLKVGRRVIVAHQGAQGMQALSEFAGEDEVADLVARCEAGARAASPFSFDALLRQSGRSFDGQRESPATSAPSRQGARRPASSGASSGAFSGASSGAFSDTRDSLPAHMRDAEIETVDLTRGRRPGGAR